MANRSSFKVEEGDILLLGTDGLFDNMHEDMIIDFISKYKVKSVTQVDKTWTIFYSYWTSRNSSLFSQMCKGLDKEEYLMIIMG